ncbi:hypothetical protein RclHR1_07750001, partial [Rhizophagus clarus]
MTVYSAIWKDGPLTYDDWKEDVYSRDANEQVALKYLNYSQDPIESIMNEAKKYLTNSSSKIQIYGMSQNSDTNDYILVQNKLINLINWTSENEKIDDFIQEMQLNIKDHSDIVFEWIPFSQFYEITKIGKGGFATIYSAIWKDGPIYWDFKKNLTRDLNKKVALKCLNNTQNLTNELLNEIKAYSTKAVNYTSGIIKVYGISQDPVTQNYVIVLQYAEGGNFNNWINVNENYKNFNWENKMQTLCYIANGLKEIHEKQMVHRDFHTGNILLISPFFQDAANRTYISDMGLCGKIGSINQNNIYGVMPYVAPEVLRGKPYTQVADIYSFGMIMYFVATGRQPFDNCAHDHNLVLDICNGVRPEISELEAPKSYIDLMKSCWNSNPENRPNVIKLYKLLRSINTSKKSEIKEAENYRKLHLSSLKGDRQITTHPQAIYTSRLLNPFTEDLDSKCLDCAVND